MLYETKQNMLVSTKSIFISLTHGSGPVKVLLTFVGPINIHIGIRKRTQLAANEKICLRNQGYCPSLRDTGTLQSRLAPYISAGHGTHSRTADNEIKLSSRLLLRSNQGEPFGEFNI